MQRFESTYLQTVHEVTASRIHRDSYKIELTSTLRRWRGNRSSRLSTVHERNNVIALRRENESLLHVATGQRKGRRRGRRTLLCLFMIWKWSGSGGASTRSPSMTSPVFFMDATKKYGRIITSFRCRPFRPSHSASRKLDLAARPFLFSLFEFPLRQRTFFFAIRCRTIAFNFYCGNRPVSRDRPTLYGIEWPEQPENSEEEKVWLDFSIYRVRFINL